MAVPGNLLAENYDPMVMANGGLRTAKPVYIDSDLTITGTTTLVGISLQDLTTTGNTILGNATSDTTLVNGVLTVTSTATVIGIVDAGGISVKSAAVPASAGAVAAGPAITMFASGPSIYVTSDTPSFSAVKGSICINTAGSGVGDRLYVNNGTTNWVAITTAS